MDVASLTPDDRRAPPPTGWHTLPPESAMSALQTRADCGLSEAAAARLQSDGPNDLPAPRTPHPVVIFLRQFRSPLVYVLLAAAVLSVGIRHLTDAGFIGFVLVVNALLGAWQELQAERQSANLRGLLRVRATVLRDAVSREIDASQLVRGDIVALASGDRVPADLRLCATQALEVDASMLTGESVPVAHDAALVCEETTPVADRANCAFAGTLVVRGGRRAWSWPPVRDGSGTHREPDDRHGGRQTAADGPHGAVQSCGGDRRAVGRGVDRLCRSTRP